MKQEIRDRWTAALRSGEYEQGVRSFESGGRFCALGVLCDALGQPTRAVDGRGNWSFVDEVLPSGIMWEVVDRNDGSLTDDGQAMPFDQLADWIDENVPVEP